MSQLILVESSKKAQTNTPWVRRFIPRRGGSPRCEIWPWTPARRHQVRPEPIVPQGHPWAPRIASPRRARSQSSIWSKPPCRRRPVSLHHLATSLPAPSLPAPPLQGHRPAIRRGPSPLARSRRHPRRRCRPASTVVLLHRCAAAGVFGGVIATPPAADPCTHGRRLWTFSRAASLHSHGKSIAIGVQYMQD
jgi:hypothetical protein